MQYIHSVREYLNPLLTTSKFKESGVLTPEEYIAAGDYLVYKFPSWSWASGEEGKRRDYLPNDKQYLVTRNVPCLKRVKQMEDTTDELNFGLLNTLSAATAATAGMEEDADGDWMTTAAGSGGAAADSSTGRERGRDLQEIEGEPCHTSTSTSAAVHLLPADKPLLLGGGEAVGGAGDEANNIQQPENIDDIPDMDEFEDAGVQEIEDLATHKISSSASPGDQTTEAATDSKILKTRTYDMSITYDKYYQTPRVWLFGYDEQRRPLNSTQVFEDISQDHAKKTVTIESHPHENLSLASIHPCKHANVMKKIIDHLVENGKGDSLRVDQYLLLFLKFMSAVLPTLEYDYTGSADV